MRKTSLHQRIFIGMFIGLIAGLGLHIGVGDKSSEGFVSAIWWLDLLGKDIFIKSLKMIIAPLIFASIISGISSLPNAGALGRIGGRTFFFYFATTSIAVFLGLVAVLTIQPGKRAASQRVRAERAADLDALRAKYVETHDGADPLAPENIGDYRVWIAAEEGARIGENDFAAKYKMIQGTQDLSAADMFRRDILTPMLDNPVNALATTNSLGIIFFAVLVGLACIAIGEPAAPVTSFFRSLNEVMIKLTLWVMEVAPLALGCIIASMVATLGMDALRSLGWYCATVIIGIALHVCVLIGIVWILGRRSPLEFIRGIQDAWLIAFSTTSSAATLPVTMECVTDNLKVSPRISNFSLPVGATMNMDGTALYEGVAVLFLIQVYGGLDDVPIVMTGMKTFVIFVTAVLASVGAAAVPSAGLITMAIVAQAVGLPLHYVPMIYAVDHLLDMFRTSTNVLGDAACTVVVDRMEGKMLAPPAA